jgi:hypothetical protein
MIIPPFTNIRWFSKLNRGGAIFRDRFYDTYFVFYIFDIQQLMSGRRCVDTRGLG